MPEDIFHQATLRKDPFQQQIDLLSQGQAFLDEGYAFTNMAAQGIVNPKSAMLKEFSQTWDTLPPDPTLAAEFGQRYRAYARLRFDVATLKLELVSDERRGRSFPFMLDAERHLDAMSEFVKYDYALTVALLEPEVENWNIGLHQIRMVCPVGQVAYPAPEGPHREGTRAIAIHMIDGMAVVGGSMWLFDNAEDLVCSKTLSKNFDTLMLDEERISHDIAPITVRTGYEPGFRDMCLVTFEI